MSAQHPIFKYQRFTIIKWNNALWVGDEFWKQKSLHAKRLSVYISRYIEHDNKIKAEMVQSDRKALSPQRCRVAVFISEYVYNSYKACCAQHRNRKWYICFVVALIFSIYIEGRCFWLLFKSGHVCSIYWNPKRPYRVRGKREWQYSFTMYEALKLTFICVFNYVANCK